MGKRKSSVKNIGLIPLESFNLAGYTKLNFSGGKIVYAWQCRKGAVKVDFENQTVEPITGHTKNCIRKRKPYFSPEEPYYFKELNLYEQKKREKEKKAQIQREKEEKETHQIIERLKCSNSSIKNKINKRLLN